jgi:hypothetical protein
MLNGRKQGESREKAGRKLGESREKAGVFRKVCQGGFCRVMP